MCNVPARPILSTPVRVVKVIARNGRVVYVPEADYRQDLAAGGQLAFAANLLGTPIETYALVPEVPGGPAVMQILGTSAEIHGWIRVIDAARIILRESGWDDPPIERINKVTAKLSRACDRGIISCVGTGRDRRIDPGSLAEFRIVERDKESKDGNDNW